MADRIWVIALIVALWIKTESSWPLFIIIYLIGMIIALIERIDDV